MIFKRLKKNLTYDNPWNSKGDKPVYKRVEPMIFLKAPGMIIKVSDIQYDYLINNQVFTQRAGANEYILDMLIENYDHIKDLSNSELTTWLFKNEGSYKNISGAKS